MGSEYDEAEQGKKLTWKMSITTNSAKFEFFIKSADFDSISAEILHSFQCMKITEGGDLGAVANSQRFKSIAQGYRRDFLMFY